MSIIDTIVQTIILVWPAYVANGSPPIIAKLIRKRRPIDFGKNFIDGRRIFGEGKTIEGFALGILSGIVISYLTFIVIKQYVPQYYYPDITAISFMCILALSGDLFGSFIKRRIGLPRGAPAPILDQLDFLVLPLIYLHVTVPKVLTSSIIVTAILLTIAMHLLTNYIAYLLGIKKEPY